MLRILCIHISAHCSVLTGGRTHHCQGVVHVGADAKVRDLDAAAEIHQHIRRLDVPVYLRTQSRSLRCSRDDHQQHSCSDAVPFTHRARLLGDPTRRKSGVQQEGAGGGKASAHCVLVAVQVGQALEDLRCDG